MKLNLSPAPHVHSAQSTRTLMLNVLIALLPCAVAGTLVFGPGALLLMLISTASAVLFEALWQKLSGNALRIAAVITLGMYFAGKDETGRT